MGHPDIVTGLVFTSDGQTLVSASHDKTVVLWDAATGQARQTLVSHQAAIWSLSPVVDCLSKPFTLTSLLERLRLAVATNAQVKPLNSNRVFSEVFIG